MNKDLVKELNKQIQEEFFSAYLYLAMSAYAASQNLNGFANWFHVQAREELDHGMGFYNYLLERGEKVELSSIAAPEHIFGTPLSMAKEALKHEKHITSRIHFLYELAGKTKDYATKILLDWYIKEQVEEEQSATKLIEKLTMIQDNKSSLYMLDKELTGRAYSAPIIG